MFWNDPNLYSVAFKDLPNYRYFHPYPNFVPPQIPPQITPQMFTPQLTPPVFPPQLTPQMFTPQLTPPVFPPQLTPQMFTPQFTQQWPVSPWMQTPPVTPFFNPMLTAYNYNYPYFDRYRPFGL